MSPQFASVAIVLGIFLIHKATFPTWMLNVYQDSSVAVLLEGRYLVKTLDSKIRQFLRPSVASAKMQLQSVEKSVGE